MPSDAHAGIATGVLRVEQTVILPFDNRIALAGLCFQSGSIEYDNVTAGVLNPPLALQLASGHGDTFASHAQHMGNQFLRHRQLV
jgi:hypothetical protein